MKNIHINNDDNYATPPAFYNELNERFNFDFDPCPYNEGEIINDGLLIEWGQRNFINPPYSRKLKEAFVLKAIEESKKGKLCVMLLPISTSTRLFQDHIQPNITEKIHFVDGRIKFGKLDKEGNFYIPLAVCKNKKGEIQYDKKGDIKYKEQTGTKDSMVVVFNGRCKHFNYEYEQEDDKSYRLCNDCVVRIN